MLLQHGRDHTPRLLLQHKESHATCGRSCGKSVRQLSTSSRFIFDGNVLRVVCHMLGKVRSSCSSSKSGHLKRKAPDLIPSSTLCLIPGIASYGAGKAGRVFVPSVFVNECILLCPFTPHPYTTAGAEGRDASETCQLGAIGHHPFLFLPRRSVPEAERTETRSRGST